jgi:hypothetical protein
MRRSSSCALPAVSVTLLEVPAELQALGLRELHAAVAVKLLKDGPRLMKRTRAQRVSR